MKNWIDYLDEDNLVVQKKSLGGDGGDSLNRTFACICLGYAPDDRTPSRSIDKLTDPTHCKYRRSVHVGKWYSEFDRTSRDQLIPLTIALGWWYRHSLKSAFLDHLTRGLLFAYNTRRNFQYPTLEEHLAKSTPDVKWNYGWKLPDLTGPEFWALYIRGFEAWYLYPLLYLFDLETMLGSIVIRFQTRKDDVINHALVLEYAKVRMDTWVMKLARLITPRSLLQIRLDTFFGKEIEPPINELYRALK